MRLLSGVIALLILLLAGAGQAAEQEADYGTPDIEIWLGEQTGRFGDFEFDVLGGRPGYPTPTGAFQVEWKSRSWWSKQWDAEMPYSVFFHGGSAIHAGSLTVTSHGCIHVSTAAARYIYNNCRDKVTRVFVYP
jgi:lipoprotein-anchoring transpeptidase ErfK/SrfK